MSYTRYAIETPHAVAGHAATLVEAVGLAHQLSIETGEYVAVYREERSRVWDSTRYPDNDLSEPETSG